jgi:hypothetical protein
MTGLVHLLDPAVASLCPSSYDGFPELRAELFESPQEQPGTLPVPGPSRSAPSSPAPRRTKQVTSRWAPQGLAQAKGCCFSFICQVRLIMVLTP